jgi:hypothetical protein
MRADRKKARRTVVAGILLTAVIGAGSLVSASPLLAPQPEASLTGVVTVRNEPMPGVTVTLAKPNSNPNDCWQASTSRPFSYSFRPDPNTTGREPCDPADAVAVVTDAQGRYRIPQLGAGNHRVIFTLEGLEPVASEVTINEGERTTLDMELSPD